jgi:hypothetical protein
MRRHSLVAAGASVVRALRRALGPSRFPSGFVGQRGREAVGNGHRTQDTTGGGTIAADLAALGDDRSSFNPRL